MRSALPAGLGDPKAKFQVFIANRPDFADFPVLTTNQTLIKGDIIAIGQACGNGWRKVFNVYAKLVYALNHDHIVSLQDTQSWQEYRDQCLLQAESNTALIFSTPVFDSAVDNSLKIIMGRAYAKSLDLRQPLQWLDNEFALDVQTKLLICPYFDYRQLSNIKIIRLVELIKGLS
jgi:hypothetical protein